MKKLVTLILAAGMVFSTANGASAVDMKVSGEWQTAFTFADNMYNDYGAAKNHEGSSDGTFKAAQRIRINFDLVASEYVSGRVQLQVTDGDTNEYNWGTAGTGGTGAGVTARLAYLDWIVPNTNVLVRMGRQSVALPSYTFGSSVLDDVIDGVVVSAPINDMVALNLGWLRPAAEVNKWDNPHRPHSSVDLAYLSLDVTGDGFKVTPWGMVGFVGSQVSDGEGGYTTFDMLGDLSNDNTPAYWVGLGGELTMFDPFKFTADFLYSGNDADHTAERSGWYAALGAEMKLSMVTPFIRGWYASGDDADSEDSGRLLSVNGSAAFDPSGIYFDYYSQISGTPDICSAGGTWGVQLGAKDVSFIQDLSHQLSVTYFQGTNNTNRVTGTGNFVNHKNDGPIGYMTTADSAWSIDFMNSYKLYENLTANLLLSYLVTDFDEKVWGQDYDNIFRGTLNFTYEF